MVAIMQAFFADKLGIFLDTIDGVQLCHNPTVVPRLKCDMLQGNYLSAP